MILKRIKDRRLTSWQNCAKNRAMERFNSLTEIPPRFKGSVIAIGNFDGVHQGHQALLGRAKELAAQHGVPCGVLTFEPHPRRLFRADEPPARLTPQPLKEERLEGAGMDFTLSLPFTWDLASLSKDRFIAEILQVGLNAAHVVIGYNFRFGQLRNGEPADIEQAGIPLSIVQQQVQPANGWALSSSAARQALRHGEIARANAILGWDWEIRGEVIKGDQRGRELGYPTANLALGESVHPAYGVYAAQVNIMGEETWFGSAVNVGIRPMFEVPIAQVEAHILDFDRDIYGKILRVRLVERLRGEAKFDTLDALTEQIDADCQQTRDVLR